MSQQTAHRVAIAEKALSSGLNPLDYFLSILRDEKNPKNDRFAAAKEAAPYMHPRLAAVEHSGNQDKPVAMQIMSGVPRDEDYDGDEPCEPARPN